MARGQWELWKDVPEPHRSHLRCIYRDLRTKGRPRVYLRKAAAKMAADLLFTTLAAGDVAVATVIQRRDGKGRRPKASQVNSAIKRQSLQIETLMKVMPGLGELASVRNGKALDTARAIAAAHAAENDR